jgi:hypothetical protein
MDLYEPIEELKSLAPDVWVVDGPIVRMAYPGFGSLPFPSRMTIVRLRSGGLWVWSPIALSAALEARVQGLGPVTHLVSPNFIHYAHVAAWKQAYPEAIAWASPGVRERARAQNVDVRFDRDLGDAPPDDWRDDLDQLIFEGSRVLREVEFLHRASRTLVIADLIENFEPQKLTFFERTLMRVGGVCAPDGKAPSDVRLTFLGRHDVARRSLQRMTEWKPERIVIAHGKLFDHDGEHELRRAFRWV